MSRILWVVGQSGVGKSRFLSWAASGIDVIALDNDWRFTAIEWDLLHHLKVNKSIPDPTQHWEAAISGMLMRVSSMLDQGGFRHCLLVCSGATNPTPIPGAEVHAVELWRDPDLVQATLDRRTKLRDEPEKLARRQPLGLFPVVSPPRSVPVGDTNDGRSAFDERADMLVSGVVPPIYGKRTIKTGDPKVRQDLETYWSTGFVVR